MFGWVQVTQSLNTTHTTTIYVVSKFIEGETLGSTLIQRRWSAIESIRFLQTIADHCRPLQRRWLTLMNGVWCIGTLNPRTY